MAKRDTKGATPVQGADVFEVLAKAAGKSKDKLTVQDIAAVGSKVGFSSKDIKRAQEGFSNAGKGFSFKLSEDGSSFDTVDEKGQLVTEVSKQAGSRKGLQVKDLISPKSKSLNYLAGLASASQGMIAKQEAEAKDKADAETKAKADILANTKSFGKGLKHAHNNPVVDTPETPKVKSGNSTTGKNGTTSSTTIPDILKAPVASSNKTTSEYTLQEAMKKSGVKGKIYTPEERKRVTDEFAKYYDSTDLSPIDMGVGYIFENDFTPEKGITSRIFGRSERYNELLPEIEKDLRKGVNIPTDRAGMIKYFNDVDRRVLKVRKDPGVLSLVGPVNSAVATTKAVAATPIVKTAINSTKGSIKSAANSLLKKGKDLFKGSKPKAPAKPSADIGKVKTIMPESVAPQSYLPPRSPLNKPRIQIKGDATPIPKPKFTVRGDATKITPAYTESAPTIAGPKLTNVKYKAKGGKLYGSNGIKTPSTKSLSSSEEELLNRMPLEQARLEREKRMNNALKTPAVTGIKPVSTAALMSTKTPMSPLHNNKEIVVNGPSSIKGMRDTQGGGTDKNKMTVNPSDAAHLAGIVAPKLLANQISNNAYKKIKNVNSVLPNLSVPIEFQPRRSNQPARFRQQLSNDAQLFTASREFDNAQRNQIRAQENAQIEESLMNQRVRNVGIKNQNENIIAGMKTRDNYANQQIDSQKVLGRASDKMSLLSDAGADLQDYYAQGRQLKAVQSSDAFQTMIRNQVPYEEAYEKAYGKKPMAKGGKLSAKNLMSKC